MKIQLVPFLPNIKLQPHIIIVVLFQYPLIDKIRDKNSKGIQLSFEMFAFPASLGIFILYMCKKQLTVRQAGPIVKGLGWHTKETEIYSVGKMKSREVLKQTDKTRLIFFFQKIILAAAQRVNCEPERTVAGVKGGDQR